MQIRTTRYFIHTRMAIIKKIIVSIGKDMEKLEHLYTASGNVNWCSCFGKLSGSSQKVKHRITIQPSNSTPGYGTHTQEKLKTYIHKKFVHKYS